jgi:integrase
MARPRLRSPEYRLKQRTNGVFYISWTECGVTKRVSTGTKNRESAKTFLRQFEAGASAPKAKSSLIADIIDAYVPTRKGKASYTSIKSTCGIISGYFGHLEPAHITQPLVSAYAKWRLGQGKSNSTVYTDLLFLKASVNWAIRQKILPESAKLTFEQPLRRSPPREKWCTKEEAKKIIEGAKAPHIKMFLILGFMTGHRREALLSLKWDMVDLENRIIDFGEGNENKRRAVVKINDTLYNTLKKAKEVATTKYVIEYGGDRVRDVRRGLGEACKRAGVEKITPHVMRHSAATWLAMSGTEIREAARMLGMSEVTFEKVYGKHHPDYLKNAAAALDF